LLETLEPIKLEFHTQFGNSAIFDVKQRRQRRNCRRFVRLECHTNVCDVCLCFWNAVNERRGGRRKITKIKKAAIWILIALNNNQPH